MNNKQKKQEYHNAFSIWASELLEDGNIYSEISRPQDWGNPKWTYGWYRLEDEDYIFHYHIYVDIPDMPKKDHFETFMQVVSMRLMPGEDKRFCDRSHLKEDDFWDDSWGDLPPHFDPYDEDY